MNTAYLLIGGNLDDRNENLEKAATLINEQCGQIEKKSSLYETAAWGKTDQPAFLNQAICLFTPFSAKQLIRKLLKIEKSMGRIRTEKLDPRVIDIDILLFGDEIHSKRFLKIPHPELQNRRFALTPLSEIAPTLIHPVFKKTILTLLDECPDHLEVNKIS